MLVDQRYTSHSRSGRDHFPPCVKLDLDDKVGIIDERQSQIITK